MSSGRIGQVLAGGHVLARSTKETWLGSAFVQADWGDQIGRRHLSIHPFPGEHEVQITHDRTRRLKVLGFEVLEP